MTMHKTVLDISAHLVHLNSLVYGEVMLHLPVVAHLKAALHHIVGKTIEEIPVVREFPDDFPYDLLGMPPERTLSSR
jgi:hypothetical protein